MIQDRVSYYGMRLGIGRKLRFFHTPAFDAPVMGLGGPRRNIATMFDMEKLKWCG